MFVTRIVRMVIDLVFGIIELIIALRIVFELFNANPLTPFISWLYSTSASLIAPFSGIFPSPFIGNGFKLDLPALIALVIYAIIAYILSMLINFISYNSARFYRNNTVVE